MKDEQAVTGSSEEREAARRELLGGGLNPLPMHVDRYGCVVPGRGLAAAEEIVRRNADGPWN